MIVAQLLAFRPFIKGCKSPLLYTQLYLESARPLSDSQEIARYFYLDVAHQPASVAESLLVDFPQRIS